MTSIREQAEQWATIIANRKGRSVQPIVSIYQWNDTNAKNDGVRIKSFAQYDIEWLNFVVACHQGQEVSQDYDVVEGGVANDNVIDTVEDYEKGIITAEQALGQLQYKKVNHQLCILNQTIIDRYLKFIESFTINTEEENT